MAATDIASPGLFASAINTRRTRSGVVNDWKISRHQCYIDEQLVQCAYGKIEPILIIEAPPRHGKTSLISEYFPAWYTGIWPDRHVLLAAHSATLAERCGRRARAARRAGSLMFGTGMSHIRDTAGEWETSFGGGMKTAGLEGDLLGYGAHLLIIDDFARTASEAFSQRVQERQWEWLQGVALRRLEPGGCVVVTAQRWHKNDLIGRLIDHASDEGIPVRRIQLRAIAEDDDVLGREPGEPLWPERFPLDTAVDDEGRRLFGLNAIRTSMPRYLWMAQYQQQPQDDIELVFNSDGLGWYLMRGDILSRVDEDGKAIASIHKNDLRLVAFIDTAGTDKDKAAEKRTGKESWSVCAMFNYWPEYRWLILRNVWRERVGFTDLLKGVNEQVGIWNPSEIIIEDKHWGQPLAAQLDDPSKVKLVNPGKEDKLARSADLQVCIENGQFLAPMEQPAWWKVFHDEVFSWTGAEGEKADQIDVASYAANYFRPATSKQFSLVGVVKRSPGSPPAKRVMW